MMAYWLKKKHKNKDKKVFNNGLLKILTNHETTGLIPKNVKA